MAVGDGILYANLTFSFCVELSSCNVNAYQQPTIYLSTYLEKTNCFVESSFSTLLRYNKHTFISESYATRIREPSRNFSPCAKLESWSEVHTCYRAYLAKPTTATIIAPSVTGAVCYMCVEY